jgi:hypothetical protein
VRTISALPLESTSTEKARDGPGTCELRAKLPEVVIQMFVHQHRPLIRCEATKETMRMRGAGLPAARDAAVEQITQAFALQFKVGLAFDHHAVHGGRVAAHGCVVFEGHRFDDRAKQASDELARPTEAAHRHFDAEGAVREHLGGSHRAPLARAVGPQGAQARDDLALVGRVEEIFHRDDSMLRFESCPTRRGR